jgi:hypothetical protein
MHWQFQECSDSGSRDLFRDSPSLRRLIETRDIGWNTWHDVVHDFTGRKLSSRLDIIRAIHGVAKLMSKTFQKRFLTGLWEHSLHQNLLWERSECDSSRTPFPYEYDSAVDSPTWPWASVQGQVNCPGALSSLAYVDKDGSTLVASIKQMTSNDAGGSLLFGRPPCPSLILLEDVEFGSVCNGVPAAKVLHLRCFLVPCAYSGVSCSGHSTPGYNYCFRDVKLAGQNSEPEGYIFLNLDCGFERLTSTEISQFHLHSPLYFVPTMYNSTQVSGIVVTSGLGIGEGVSMPDDLTYRRIGTLRVIKRGSGNFQVDSKEDLTLIPPIVEEWVSYMREASTFAPSKKCVKG